MTCEKPLPQPNPDTQPFWNGYGKHELRFQKCDDCGHVRWQASMICPMCYSTDTGWIVARGRGKVYSYVVYHRAYHPAFNGDLPYVVAVVELDEGPHLLTNIVGCPPEDAFCEMPVEVSWDDVAEGISLPKFRPSP
ncbi:MAG: OB-fold domain-containing protein [Deltaproteobacteria bacterium]|nr:OB-fold domain-containing protein [Deltaproteobacteria bacterium]